MNFLDSLDTELGSFERPPLIPAGTYVGMVTKHPAADEVGDGNWDVCDFSIRLIEAMATVNSEELAVYGNLGPHSVVRHRFMFDKNDKANFDRSMFRLRQFLEEHLRCATPSTSLREALQAAQNTKCLITITHRSRKDQPELMDAQVGKTGPID
jgi:hypothetical protein